MRRFGRGGGMALAIAIGWSLLAIGGGAPTAAAGPGVATMSVGELHSCAVRTNGTVWCWGDAAYGQVGDGTTGDATTHHRTTPVRVRRGSSVLKGVTKVSVGSLHSCAIRVNGTVWCWGNASSGQLGDGTTGGSTSHIRTKAVQVRRGSGHLTSVKQVTAGLGHTCALRTDGSVWCWGGGASGQLGDGTTGAGHHRTKATHVRRGSGYLTKAKGIAAGASHTCARRADGSAWCWGLGAYGQLGDGTTGGPTTQTRAKAVRVLRGGAALTGVTGIGAGTDHTCARRSDGSAWCWGSALHGQLGDGTTGDTTSHVRLKAVRVVRPAGAFTGVRTLDGGDAHTCALRTDRTVWCWGGNANGQSGRGTRDDDPHPYPRKVVFP